jgi:hypothetical protein
MGEVFMLTSIVGVYRDGQIILPEVPGDLPNETQVIVTFLGPTTIDLPGRGIDTAHAADLRARLRTFAVDWDSADMDIYNDYDANKAAL